MKSALVILPLLLIAGCASDSLPPGRYLNQSLGLSAAGLQRQTQRAQRGDGEAAYRIATHYSFYVQDDIQGQEWLRRASALGYPMAQSALGMRLVDEPSDASKAEGLMLIRRSAKAGDEMSLWFLRHLDYLQTFTEKDLTRVQHRIPKMVELIRYLQGHPDEVVDVANKPNQSSQPTPRRG